MIVIDDTDTKLALYDMVARIMKPPLFPAARMLPSQAVAAAGTFDIVADLNDLIATATALRDRIAAASTAAMASVTTPTRTYRVAAEAFRDRGFPFNDQKVRRLCRANAVGKPDGAQFAQMLAGTWHVIDPAFSQWAERN